mgnify:CR=1 FL=1
MKYHHDFATAVYTALSRLRSYTVGEHMIHVSQSMLADASGLHPRYVRYGIDTINRSPKYGFYIAYNKREGHFFLSHKEDIAREEKVLKMDFDRLNERKRKIEYIKNRNQNHTIPFGEEME